MKKIKLLLFALIFAPLPLFAAGDFNTAAQLLAAAKNADIAQVQSLVNAGADINYVDNTGLSIVCTALMNNDFRAAQILQMYGADASQCDKQIKKYNQKKPSQDSGGLFGGLSSAQGIALAAAGAAVVVGGILLLPDLFSSGNNNSSGGSSGGVCRPNSSCQCANGSVGTCRTDGTCDCSGGGGNNSTAAFTLPFGPAMPNAESETANYTQNLNYFSPTTAGILKDNFNLMTNVYKHNYLLMMHGYSPMARGYMGMTTLRNITSKVPINLEGNNLGTEQVLGGRPINVALITTNGINAKSDSSLGDVILPWTTLNANGTTANGASNDMISSKYYNNTITRGTDNNSIFDDSTHEDTALLGILDLSGSGSSVNNSFAGFLDDMMGKIVGGTTGGYTNADFFGFMPNGQMTIFRTGGGMGMKDGSGAVSGTKTGGTTLANGDVLTLFGFSLTVTKNTDDKGFVATDGINTYKGYVGADGLLYIDSTNLGLLTPSQLATYAGRADHAYTIQTNGDLTFDKQLGNIDYYNYRALLNSGALWISGDLSGAQQSRSRPAIVANASVIKPLHAADAKTVNDILSTPEASRAAKFIEFVNDYYDRDTTDGVSGTNALPGSDAAAFFGGLGSTFSPITIFSTGAFETDSNFSGATMVAGFENAAPLVFNNLKHLFMSVVAVQYPPTGNGTSGTANISGFTPPYKLSLSQWYSAGDDAYYKARACGIAGRGANGIDPWCFAAAGLTDELAVASMAGAVGSIKSAFNHLSNKELFALLALTADGPFLATRTDGTILTTADLKAYLQSMYQMPAEYDYRWQSGGEDYFAVFKEVFGYGLINLERATKPTSKIWFYDGNNIVSDSGNGYWRSASSTKFRSSSVFNPRGSSISAPFYDVLESVDGSLSLPRVWENEFALGVSDKRGLYMGDVLGEFKVSDDKSVVKDGNFTFEMGMSERAYTDNMGGLDNMQFGYSDGKLSVLAGYQHNFTDGLDRFDATSNPILSMTSDAISTDVNYNMGNWKIGARAFSGSITDESLLDNDPTISSQYAPAKLGLMQGAESNMGWNNNTFGFVAAVGTAHESDTILGAQTGGLLALGAGDTLYIDSVATFKPIDDVVFSARATYAKTSGDPNGQFILGLTDIESNAFSARADIGKFSFAVAQPLSVVRGNLKYAHADYEVVENDAGNFDLVVRDTHIANLDLSPTVRELRFSGSYMLKLGEFTDSAFGFVYRVHPNNTDDFGDESILMMKIRHKIGI